MLNSIQCIFVVSSPTFFMHHKIFCTHFLPWKESLKNANVATTKVTYFLLKPWHEFWNIFCLCCVSHQIFSSSKINTIMVVKNHIVTREIDVLPCPSKKKYSKALKKHSAWKYRSNLKISFKTHTKTVARLACLSDLTSTYHN